MEIGDKILVKGEVIEIRQTKTGYLIKVSPDYKKLTNNNINLEIYDSFIVDESCIINETDEINQMANDYNINKFNKTTRQVEFPDYK